MKKIQILQSDYDELRQFLSEYHPENAEAKACCESLTGELDRAEIKSASDLPADVITLGRRATLTELKTGDSLEYTVVMPEDANVAEGRISILAPLGTAMLGFRTGDEFEWTMPGGVMKLRVKDVTAVA